jgi:hypothetical protein
VNEATPNNPLDQATQARLGKLRSMPVDTTRLDLAMERLLPRPREGAARILHMRPVKAAAAVIALVTMVGVVLWSLSGGAVLAAPDMMARFHQEMIDGKVQAIEVQDIAQANQALASQWEQTVQIPQVPDGHAMLCCMRTIKDKRVACVLLRDGNSGVPVTMAVAKAVDLRMPDTQSVVREGVKYHLQTSGDLHMVMTERDGRFFCLISELPTEDLIKLVQGITF